MNVRDIAERHGLGQPEIDALTVFAERVRGSDHGGGVKEKWRMNAVARLAESLEALALEQVRAAKEGVDIGSGAGFPGLALAGARPEMRMTLIEQKDKRCTFLRESIEAMGLTNVEVVQRLVQLWAEGQDRFDLVTSRGVLKLPVMVGLAAPLLKVGGTVVLWGPELKSAVEDEAGAAAGRLGLVLAEVVRRPGLCLHAYTRLESPAAWALEGAQPLQPSDRVLPRQRQKISLKLPKCEARIAKIGAMIAEFEEARTRASETQLAQLDSDIERLEAHKQRLDAHRRELLEQEREG
jgi:16S rRNA (guanine(527)-N(7))-methyltransferase RsmG